MGGGNLIFFWMFFGGLRTQVSEARPEASRFSALSRFCPAYPHFYLQIL